MNSSKINTLDAIMLILIIVVTHTILSLPRNILLVTKSASIINLIYISIIAIFIAYFIFRLMQNFAGLDLLDISEFLGGKNLKTIIGIIYIVYFLISSSILLRNFCESLKIIYYPITEIKFIILLFIVALCMANRLDFSATIKTNSLILPFVLGSIIFLFFSNMNKFVPERIFPILGDGVLTTFGWGLINLASFGGISYLYFLPPLLNEPQKMKKISLISIGVSAIYLILCVSTLLFMFSFFLDTNEITPLYNATRYIEFGNFFQRLESIFLLFWILAVACYMSIVSKFSMKIFEKLTNIENKKELIDIFLLLIFGISIAPKNYAISQMYETKIYPYLVLGIVFVLSISILIIANLSKRRKKSTQKEEQHV